MDDNTFEAKKKEYKELMVNALMVHDDHEVTRIEAALDELKTSYLEFLRHQYLEKEED